MKFLKNSPILDQLAQFKLILILRNFQGFPREISGLASPNELE